MRNLTTTICLTLAVLLGSEVRGSDLPVCEGSPVKVTSQDDYFKWHNCEGTIIFGPSFLGYAGDKYVGEFKDGIPNGRGTYTFSRE